ncbi:von Willebrand factor C and EGF domain-containing protein isoform X7 [Myotis myotis]|uniref:von Willebrand factor C and EGF domain-containing protein isoform X7 n=1 Tax=Myotis myotis TaxID=51298 RepID=UPI0017499BA2|nr:von Willebrand factor C and EGF domain-containing protein isoform X7 [Myotis myotis]
MWAGLLLAAAGVALLLPGAPARGYTGRKPSGHLGTERRRLGPHVCLSGFGSGCCPGWAPSMGSGHCTLPLCSFGCGRGICIAPNVCSCQDGEQGATCPEAHGPCGEYGCDLACNHGGCQEVARVCPVGFSMTETAVGIRCTDIDECLSSSCEGRCVNTEGGFVCECGPGMQLSADRHSCQDTDECLGTPCQQRCRNSIGSYTCSCRPGFHLHGNRHSCVDVNECRRPQERRVCHHACHNTVGSFLCTCRPGFRLRADRVSCEGRPCASVPAFPTAVLAPSAILQPPPNMLLLPEAGRPALSPGHPPPGAPGPPAGVRTTCPPAHTSSLPAASPSVLARLLSTPMATPVPSVPLLGTLRPSTQPQEKGVTPSLPRSPTAPQPTLGPSACWHLGAMHESGSHWTEPGCSQCWCEDGQVTCEEATCEAACSHPIPSGDGGCCPSCTGCFHGGVIRAEGAVFSPPAENCTVCVCLAALSTTTGPSFRWDRSGLLVTPADGSVSCKRTDCVDSCPHPIRIPGQCCPDCSAGCTYTGRTFHNNQTFPSVLDPCLSCICLLGSVACSPVDCPIACSYPFHPDGQCCPVCRDCNFEGRKVGNGQVFTLDDEPCTQCTCQLGEVSCEKAPCRPACGDSATPPGDCCASCPDSPEDGRGLPPPADAALSPRRAPQDPATCSSCPGPPAAQPQRPAPHFLQLLLRTNVSNRQTLPRSHSGAQASPLPPAGPSPGPPVPPGASSLPPASPGAPATPEPSATASALPPAVLPEAPALSTADPSSPEAPATLHGLAPAASGLSAARVATTSPGTPQPPPRTASEEESAG